MKIDKRTPGVTGKTVSATQGKATKKTGTPAKAGGEEKLQIAASTSQLRELESQMAKLDISDAAKIEAIKSAIDSGTFEVDSEVVADRLIDTAKESVRKRNKKR
jgi:negative regulator of flagellin synthesis FlgM